ncbi:MAG: hypothetical protein RMK89_04170 [Armatimonadota bacterium]|nr:hypothetical protein [Armatimonadota bacterium]MDW8142642.1 hypothetical protein [Armatimonadota bacterium]
MPTAKPLDKIVDWLAYYLSNRYPKAVAIVKPTTHQTVAEFISRNNLSRYFPDRAMFQVIVDVCGVSLSESTDRAILAIVKFCNNAITLNDCLIFKGYAQIVHPHHAFIISPKGWTPSLHRLVRDFKRVDILEYAPGKLVVVAKWDHLSNSVRPGDVLLHGVF